MEGCVLLVECYGSGFRTSGRVIGFGGEINVVLRRTCLYMHSPGFCCAIYVEMASLVLVSTWCSCSEQESKTHGFSLLAPAMPMLQ